MAQNDPLDEDQESLASPPLALPVVARARQLLEDGQYDEAVRGAFTQAVADLQSAYGLSGPPGWSYPELFERKFRGLTGELSRLLELLYEFYRPVRYGPPVRARDPEEFLTALERLYGKWVMWATERPDLVRAPPEGRRSRPPRPATPPRSRP